MFVYLAEKNSIHILLQNRKLCLRVCICRSPWGSSIWDSFTAINSNIKLMRHNEFWIIAMVLFWINSTSTANTKEQEGKGCVRKQLDTGGFFGGGHVSPWATNPLMRTQLPHGACTWNIQQLSCSVPCDSQHLPAPSEYLWEKFQCNFWKDWVA